MRVYKRRCFARGVRAIIFMLDADVERALLARHAKPDIDAA